MRIDHIGKADLYTPLALSPETPDGFQPEPAEGVSGPRQSSNANEASGQTPGSLFGTIFGGPVIGTVIGRAIGGSQSEDARPAPLSHYGLAPNLKAFLKP